MKRKLVMCLVLLGLSVSITACGDEEEEAAAEENQVQEEESKEEEKSEEESQEEAAEPVEETAAVDLGAYMDKLKDSSWSGVDASGRGYLVTLKDGTFSMTISDSESGETAWEGSYELTPEGLEFLESEDLLKELGDITWDYSLDGANSYLQVNDIYLSLQDQEANIEKLKDAILASEYLGQGRCWIACLKDRAFVFVLNGQQITLEEIVKEGEELVHKIIDGNWSMDQESLDIIDQEDICLENFSWTFEEEEELKVLTLTMAEEEAVFYETGAENSEKAVEMAEMYLQNQASADEIEDLTTVLNGYEGVSIVDAFIMAGLDPSIENRGIFAEKFEIEDYRGTAKQNLFLLESMGGTIKG